MVNEYYVMNGVKVKVNRQAKPNTERARKKDEDLRAERVVVHVTGTEKELIKELAKENGMDTSSFIRCLCLYQYNKMAGGMIK
ncbi:MULTISPECIES: CopG family transcriptional regulator [unclassified Clostridium]|uniref:plasmid mobilization protein n=1 Tax=unclassified Clostridium TaxID=2614128 RepID=UPI000297C139|nr:MULTISPECIES: CopG family transcriptional regulator [unclassified Clostridium]EKQ56404.1 MAG: Ribbon-helix-helix protein, copG family [Clostridium sp. Maddingley MBC34-26]